MAEVPSSTLCGNFGSAPEVKRSMQRCSLFLHRVQNTLLQGPLIRGYNFLNPVQQCRYINIQICGASAQRCRRVKITDPRLTVPRCSGWKKSDPRCTCTEVRKKAKEGSPAQCTAVQEWPKLRSVSLSYLLVSGI